MAEKIQFSFVGKLIKTFGYKGELIAHIENSFCKKITKTEFVFVEIQHERVPFFIMSIENQSGNIFSLMLEDTDNPEKAQSLIGCRLFLAEKGKRTKQKDEIDYLTGFEVNDQKSGIIGNINQILRLPQQFIMQIYQGKKEILIPFNEDIVSSIDTEHKIIFISAPEGLIDFYLK